MGVADMLRDTSTPAENSSNLIECQGCGAMVPPDVELCPECFEPPVLTTLKEWGAKLPIGVIEGKSLKKSFDVGRINWKVDKAISNTWNRYQKLHGFRMSDYIGAILAHTVTKINEEDFTKHDIDRRMVILNEMFLGDAFYMYAYLRMSAIGNELPIVDLVCPWCNHKDDYTADLNTLEVAVRKTVENLEQEVELEVGFDLMGKKCKKLTLKPPLLRVMQGEAEDVSDEAGIVGEVLKTSVTKIDCAPDGTVLTEKEIETIDKIDLNILDDAINAMTSGPIWRLEFECKNPKCGKELSRMIDWTYQGFFGRSSRSRRRRRRSGR